MQQRTVAQVVDVHPGPLACAKAAGTGLPPTGDDNRAHGKSTWAFNVAGFAARELLFPAVNMDDCEQNPSSTV